MKKITSLIALLLLTALLIPTVMASVTLTTPASNAETSGTTSAYIITAGGGWESNFTDCNLMVRSSDAGVTTIIVATFANATVTNPVNFTTGTPAVSGTFNTFLANVTDIIATANCSDGVDSYNSTANTGITFDNVAPITVTTLSRSFVEYMSLLGITVDTSASSDTLTEIALTSCKLYQPNGVIDSGTISGDTYTWTNTDLNAIGTYKVDCTATDSQGNTNTASNKSFDVMSRDKDIQEREVKGITPKKGIPLLPIVGLIVIIAVIAITIVIRNKK